MKVTRRDIPARPASSTWAITHPSLAEGPWTMRLSLEEMIELRADLTVAISEAKNHPSTHTGETP